MFGIAVARLDQVSDAERARYEELYCGLCRSIRSQYGQISRAALSYDLAFLSMLLNSLNEYPEVRGSEHCITHPAKKMPFAESKATEYAADVSIILAYHKCLDDIADDDSLTGRAGRSFLKSAYEKAKKKHPDICETCENAMTQIHIIENAPNSSPDAASIEFGKLLGEIFVFECGLFAETMRNLGYSLGRFIYMMDAAVDLRADIKNNSYNPFKGLNMNATEMRVILETLIATAALEFEKLPLEQDVHLMRSVIYSGVWQKFNQTYEKKDATRDADERKSI